jgi:predicted ATPase
MKLGIEDLARIKEAEIEVKNLTLFVGQNSTHKSNMAHVIYELYKELSNFSNKSKNKVKLSRYVVKKFHQNFEDDINYILSLKKEIFEEVYKYEVGEDEFDVKIFTIVKFFTTIDDNRLNDIFANIQKLILKKLTKTINNSFNFNKKIIKDISIEENNSISNQGFIELTFNTPLKIFEYKKVDISALLLSKIIDKVILTLQSYLNNYNELYYFPTSRAGLILTLDEINPGIVRDKFKAEASARRLGEPTIDFIQTFADIKNKTINKGNISNKKEIKELITFLEKNIIKGQIKELKNEQYYASYSLETNGLELDLHLASSATLETLPFIVFLKNIEDISKTFFVIEGPEAHLHPKAQIYMARFLVMLSNAGAKVLVTTHSDYILNEINNCIKLDELNEKKDFTISKDSVSAYLFKNEENETIVKKLEIDKYGISNDNFDEELKELLDTSNELNKRIIDNE